MSESNWELEILYTKELSILSNNSYANNTHKKYSTNHFLLRLVPEPKCVKVPKEICVNTKKNPRVVKKPIVKEWCYNPKDLLENAGSFPTDLLNPTETEEEEAGADAATPF